MKYWPIVFHLLLASAVLGSALAVVFLQHESRSLFVQRQRLQSEQDEFQVEWSRLQLEQAWLGDASRIEQLAREQLSMVPAQQSELMLIDP
ncbi:MAG: cell division protein FtsL [Xanthomonadales bacterium]|nr:cell division protein FtsL [Xanthomonadales bacterium]